MLPSQKKKKDPYIIFITCLLIPSFYSWYSFCEPLMDSHDHSKIRYKEEECMQEGQQACKIQWKVSKSHRNAHILRKLLSVFIKEIVEGMIGYVSLPRIILKLLSDNETQEFGDFKPTILGMLGTYDFERRILVGFLLCFFLIFPIL